MCLFIENNEWLRKTGPRSGGVPNSIHPSAVGVPNSAVINSGTRCTKRPNTGRLRTRPICGRFVTNDRTFNVFHSI